MVLWTCQHIQNIGFNASQIPWPLAKYACKIPMHSGGAFMTHCSSMWFFTQILNSTIKIKDLSAAFGKEYTIKRSV